MPYPVMMPVHATWGRPLAWGSPHGLPSASAIPVDPPREPLHPVEHAMPTPKPVSRRAMWMHLALSGASFATGLLLHRLPEFTRPGIQLLPTDWKIWARVGLGIAATSQLNKAFDWKPAPWLSGMETVAVMHPLTSGFGLAAMKQLLVLAPMVGGLVQLTSSANDELAKAAKAELGVPPAVTRLAVSAMMLVLGIGYLPKLYEPLMKLSWFRQGAAATAAESSVSSNSTLALNTVRCLRGCTPGGVICMSEMGEMVGSLSGSMTGGLGQWATNTKRKGNV